MPETIFQPEEQLADQELELSPAELLQHEWPQYPGPPLLKQKAVLDRHPDLVGYAGMASMPGWSWPYAFALQILVAVAVVASLFNWFITRDAGKLHEELVQMQAATDAELDRQQGILDATQAEISRISHSSASVFHLKMSPEPLSREQALAQLNTTLADTKKTFTEFKQRMQQKEKELRAAQNAKAVALSGVPLFFSLALVLCAGSVQRGIQRDYSRAKFARHSGDFFLYFASTQGLLLNLAFLFLLHFGLSAASWGFADLMESLGPVFWVALSLG
ncbi:MAG TPA: hypothetical protein VE783_00290, partial [Candidatus Limnocylindrales bacterium]|nr:hypothetical protein [Candidatus Limnocylindrales bacterium]